MRKPLIAATLVGLLALVAFGSRSGAWGGDEGPREISSTAVDYAVTIGLIVLVGLIILAIASFRSMKGQVKLERVSGLKQLIFFMTVLTVLGYIGLTNARLRPEREEENDDVLGPPREEEREDATVARDRRAPELQWWLLVVAGAAGTAAVIWYRRKPRREPRGRDEIVAEQLTAVLTDTLDDLEFERDARRAVIRAYARMEAVLAAHGLPRLPSEAPLEYLARILRELKVRAEAAHALTELFERAKFSQHEIDAAMKQEAIDALATVRDDLKAAA
jgi:Domain of unknown function (DUF4129)